MNSWGINVIEVGNQDVPELMGLDIVAIQIASPGAMGYHAGVFFVTAQGQTYFTCYMEPSDYTGNHKYMSWDNLTKVLPPLNNRDQDLREPSRWSEEYLGFGNRLFVKNSIGIEFRKKAEFLLKSEPGSILYNKWLEAVLSVL